MEVEVVEVVEGLPNLARETVKSSSSPTSPAVYSANLGTSFMYSWPLLQHTGTCGEGKGGEGKGGEGRGRGVTRWMGGRG